MSEIYEAVKKIIGECLEDAIKLLVDAGFDKSYVYKNMDSVVQVALKLAETKGSFQLLEEEE